MSNIDWVGTALGCLFLWLLHYMKSHGHRLPGGWVIRSGLALMGGVFLAFSIVGVLLLKGFTLLPSIVAGVLMLAAIIVTIVGVGVDRRVDKPELVAMIMLPLLVLAAAGPIANAGTNVVDDVHSSTKTTLSHWLS